MHGTAMRLGYALLCLAIGVSLGSEASAQKRGGVLTLSHIDSPPSPSIQEEGTSSVLIPFMAMFNNLVMYDQHKPINNFDTIVPELGSGRRTLARLSFVTAI